MGWKKNPHKNTTTENTTARATISEVALQLILVIVHLTINRIDVLDGKFLTLNPTHTL